MRILVIGPKVPDFDSGYNLAVLRAFRNLGHSAELLEFYTGTPPGLQNRILIDLGGMLGATKHLESYIHDFNVAVVDAHRRLQPDVAFVVRGSKVDTDTLQTLRAGGTRLLLWCQDRVERSELSEQQLRAYDSIYVFEPSDVELLRSKYALRGVPLLMGYDPEVYFPRADQSKDIDLFFVGAYYPERRSLLETLAERLPHRRLRFCGRNLRYRQPGSWFRYLGYKVRYPATFVNRSLDAQEINEYYARSRICLNIHHGQSESGCNPRVFEILGAGAFQLVDRNRFVEEELSGCAVTFDGADDLCRKVEEFLENDSERRRISQSGLLRVQQRHTFVNRISFVVAAEGLG